MDNKLMVLKFWIESCSILCKTSFKTCVTSTVQSCHLSCFSSRLTLFGRWRLSSSYPPFTSIIQLSLLLLSSSWMSSLAWHMFQSCLLDDTIVECVWVCVREVQASHDQVEGNSWSTLCYRKGFFYLDHRRLINWLDSWQLNPWNVDNK